MLATPTLQGRLIAQPISVQPRTTGTMCAASATLNATSLSAAAPASDPSSVTDRRSAPSGSRAPNDTAMSEEARPRRQPPIGLAGNRYPGLRPPPSRVLCTLTSTPVTISTSSITAPLTACATVPASECLSANASHIETTSVNVSDPPVATLLASMHMSLFRWRILPNVTPILLLSSRPTPANP